METYGFFRLVSNANQFTKKVKPISTTDKLQARLLKIEMHAKTLHLRIFWSDTFINLKKKLCLKMSIITRFWVGNDISTIKCSYMTFSVST